MTTRNLLLVGASFAAIAFGFLSSSMVSSRQASGGWRPFTAFLVEQKLSAEGKLPTQDWPDVEYTTFARRSDGSSVTVFKRRNPNGDWVWSRRITDLAAGKELTVDPMTESVTTYPLPARNLESSRMKPQRCSQDSNPELGRMAGYDTEKVHRQIPAPEGSEHDFWMAPSLDCFPLNQKTKFADGYVNDRHAIFVLEGEPSPALFQVPGSYAERSPSQVFAEYAKRFPGYRGAPQRTQERLDRVYISSNGRH